MRVISSLIVALCSGAFVVNCGLDSGDVNRPAMPLPEQRAENGTPKPSSSSENIPSTQSPTVPSSQNIGPFSEEERAECRSLGGGSACDSSIWDKEFATKIKARLSAAKGLTSPQTGTSVLASLNIGASQGTAWTSEWSASVAAALEQEGNAQMLEGSFVPGDALELCKSFPQASRESKKAFWVLVFASMARHESGFNTKSRNDADPGGSLGLLQLSRLDGGRHAPCPINTETDALDPLRNLACGVAIMRDQIRKTKSLFNTGVYYWAVLQKDHKSTKWTKIRDEVMAGAKQIRECSL